MAARTVCMEDVIIISDEETERQNSHRGRGAGARFENTKEEWLDYEKDVDEQVMPVLKSVAKGATQSVPEVVRGDRSGNRHRDVAVGNLPRAEEFDWGSANFGFGRQVGVGSGANFGSGPGG
ncbi:hypothetical protein NDU88_009361 [Pleurodeles waltl]|uniref:Uncharacterized protein n=1 Tax=Pleurodeles waltl TaxID=8319 RepID=A0AAV7S064_PLEWA|nr:hypothetical protein NDU88_009361 [Pleurodeles waltl]